MAITKQVLGKVLITNKGEYSSSKTYEILDVVSYKGSSYISKENDNTTIPTSGKWQLLAEKGDTYQMTQDDFDKIVKDITENANSEFNKNAKTQTDTFNTNADTKTTEFNNNAKAKTDDFNTNASDKLTEYNTNHDEKINSYNENASAKVSEFDSHVDDMQDRITDLEANQISDSVGYDEEVTDIHVEDSANMRVMKFNFIGDMKQEKNPSPDYPQEIEVVEPYNIFENKLEDQVLNGIEYKVNEDKSISIKGTATARSEPIIQKIGETSLVLKKGITYSYTDISNKVIVIISTKNIGYIVLSSSKPTYTPSEDANVHDIHIRVENGVTIDETIYPQIVVGENIKSYVPFKSINVKLQNKNYLKIKTFIDGTTKQTKNGITAIINSNGSIAAKGTATSDTIFYIKKENFDLSSGNYSYQTNSINTNARVEFSANIDEIVKYLNSYGKPNNFSFNNSFIFNSLSLIIKSGTTVNYIFEQGIFDGNEQTSYVPHQEQNYQLTLDREITKGMYPYKKDDKWYWHKEWKAVELTNDILNHSSNDLKTTYNIPQFRLVKGPTGLERAFNKNVFLMTSYSANNTRDYNDLKSGQFNEFYDMYYINIADDRFTSLETAKSLLLGEKVAFKLAEPEEIEITDQTLIDQLNALSKAKMYKGVTNISVEGSNVKPLLQLEYNKDLQITLDNMLSMIVDNASK